MHIRNGQQNIQQIHPRFMPTQNLIPVGPTTHTPQEHSGTRYTNIQESF